MAASPAAPSGPHTDPAQDPGHKAAEEPPKEDRRLPEGLQAAATAALPETEGGGVVLEGTGEVGSSQETGIDSGLRHRRTQGDSELRSEEREQSVLPTNSSSKYSFVALEQRKEELLKNAKRYGLFTVHGF